MQGQAESYETIGLAYTVLADRGPENSKKSANLREARSWLQKSLRTWELDASQGTGDPAARRESDRIRKEIANCESALAKI